MKITEEIIPRGFPALISYGFLTYVSFVWSIKRAHDRERSGFFTVLVLIPILNLWPIIELGFFKGTDGPNTYGPDPLTKP